MSTLEDAPPSPAQAQPVIDENVFATLDLEMNYACANARHTVRRHAPAVNMWRDIFPAGLDGDLMGKRVGDRVRRSIPTALLVGPRQSSLVRQIKRSQFEGNLGSHVACRPDIGRFLPQGTLYRAEIAGVYRDSLRPFRVLDATDDTIIADLNPPFAGFNATISATVQAVAPKLSDVGGRCQDWGDVLMTGAGMQVRAAETPTDFFVGDWNARTGFEDDPTFYATPRHIAHLDQTAIGHVRAIYGALLKSGDAVLDLMSSTYSHLPEETAFSRVAGLGMNAEELAANPALSEHIVHDLNATPALPFETASFDAVVCTVSVEYLTRPLDVFAEIARVLKPGGVVAFTFSNRWFPPKVIKVWREAHPAERMGLVLEYFLRTGHFGDLETLTVEGYARPADDPHAMETDMSDPVFAVWGRRR